MGACRSVGGTGPEPPSPSPALPAAGPAVTNPPSSPAPDLPFDPGKISQEEKQETLISVADLILELNRITREKNFQAWKAYLTEDFIEYYSSKEVLAALSQKPILRMQKIVLKSLEDYFNYVVYPSHQNDRVDDIDYIGHNRVKAITLNAKMERLVLWDLEKVGDSWKIGIGR